MGGDGTTIRALFRTHLYCFSNTSRRRSGITPNQRKRAAVSGPDQPPQVESGEVLDHVDVEDRHDPIASLAERAKVRSFADVIAQDDAPLRVALQDFRRCRALELPAKPRVTEFAELRKWPRKT